MSATSQDQLGTVSDMATTLADRILMDRMIGRVTPIAKAETLWAASLLLEANQQPVPVIVTEALAQFRHPEADNDPEPVVEPGMDRAGGPMRVLSRLLRPLKAMVAA